jgi:hypothetical protein
MDMEPVILDRPALACLGLRRCTLELQDAEALCSEDPTAQERLGCFSAWLGPAICCGMISHSDEGEPLVRGTWQAGCHGGFRLDPDCPDALAGGGPLRLRLRLDVLRHKLLGRVEGHSPAGGWVSGPWIDLADT